MVNVGCAHEKIHHVLLHHLLHVTTKSKNTFQVHMNKPISGEEKPRYYIYRDIRLSSKVALTFENVSIRVQQQHPLRDQEGRSPGESEVLPSKVHLDSTRTALLQTDRSALWNSENMLTFIHIIAELSQQIQVT